MIVDTLENGPKYASIHPRFAKAFEFLQNTDLHSLKDGRHEIDGDAIFAICAREQGRKKEDAQIEAHNNYIDIQLVLEGVDEMGWRDRKSCKTTAVEYSDEEDIVFFADKPSSWIRVTPGQFALFFPEDAHLPLISEKTIHKIVVKILQNG